MIFRWRNLKFELSESTVKLHVSWNKWNETIVEREMLKIIIDSLGKRERILRVNCRSWTSAEGIVPFASFAYLVQQTTTITRNPNNARLIRVILAVYINNTGPVYGGDNSQCVRWEKWFEENIKQAFRYICYSPLERLWDIRVDISSWLLDNWIQTKFSIDENESKRLVEIIYREIKFQSDRKSRLTFLSLSLSPPPFFLFKFFLLVAEQNFTDNKRTITKCANFHESSFFFLSLSLIG